MTSGNHIWKRREIIEYFPTQPRLLRPANFPEGSPGKGLYVGTAKNGVGYAVLNLQGRTYMTPIEDPFRMATRELANIAPEVKVIFVDMHAEATSEKVAMGWHLDGKVSAVVGTHTHVPTADFRVLPAGTAYITDVGMTGPRGGVIGVKREQAIEALLTQMPIRFETSDQDPWLMGVFIRCSQPLRADSIEQVLMPRPPGSDRDR